MDGFPKATTQKYPVVQLVILCDGSDKNLQSILADWSSQFVHYREKLVSGNEMVSLFIHCHEKRNQSLAMFCEVLFQQGYLLEYLLLVL